MSTTRVVILASPSLFVDGVASRLRRPDAHAEVLTVNPHDRDAIERTIAAAPQAVILDAADPALRRETMWTKLLQAVPGVRILDLDSRTQLVRVVTSEERLAADVADLIDVLQPPEAMGGKV